MSRRTTTIAMAIAQFVLLTFLVAVAGPAHAFDKDCGDFANQKKAQEFFLQQGGPQSDPHGLDSEGDGIACESNPCPCYYGTKPPGSNPPAPPPPVRSTVELTASRTSGIAGERVRFVAQVSPRLSRPVVLQRKAGDRWVKVEAGKTTTKGRWVARTPVRRSTTVYRAAIAAVKKGDKRYTAATSSTRTVKTLPQKVTLQLSDGSVFRDERVVASISATPVRANRPVILWKRTGSDWVEVGSDRLNRSGEASVVVPTGSTGTFSYRAVVQPFKGAGPAVSPKRELDVAPPPDTKAPGVPSGLAATAGDGSVVLDWADVTASDLRGYHVYYATSAAGPWTRVTSQPVTGSSHTATGLTNGTAYYFRVTSVDQAGNESAPSQSVQATPAAPDTTAPDAPQGLVATPSDGAVLLDWDDVTTTDLAGYRVYIATTADGPWTSVTTSPVTTSTYNAEGLTNGTEYFFRVTAVDTAGNESPASEPVQATPAAAAQAA